MSQEAEDYILLLKEQIDERNRTIELLKEKLVIVQQQLNASQELLKDNGLDDK